MQNVINFSDILPDLTVAIPTVNFILKGDFPALVYCSSCDLLGKTAVFLLPFLVIRKYPKQMS